MTSKYPKIWYNDIIIRKYCDEKVIRRIILRNDVRKLSYIINNRYISKCEVHNNKYMDNDSLLSTAIKYNKIEIIKILLRYINDKRVMTYHLDDIREKIIENNLQVMKLLLDYCGYNNMYNYNHFFNISPKEYSPIEIASTPLDLACAEKRYDMVKLILDTGIENPICTIPPNIKSGQIYLSPLVTSYLRKDHKTVELLVKTFGKKLIDYSYILISKSYISLLGVACYRNDYKSANLFLKYGANIKNNQPIMIALSNNNIKMVRLLLCYGFKITGKNIKKHKKYIDLLQNYFQAGSKSSSSAIFRHFFDHYMFDQNLVNYIFSFLRRTEEKELFILSKKIKTVLERY